METTYDTQPTENEILALYSAEFNSQVKPIEKKQPKQKTPEDEKKPIVIGVVDDIKQGNSKFGYSFKIYIAGQVYFFNCKEESTVHKMFTKGQKAAFTMEEVNGFKKILSVFYTF